MALARVAELADAQDLKSCGVTPVPVRFRSRALYFLAQIAQLVEQRTENPRVAGSIPALGIFPVYLGILFLWATSSGGRALDF